MVTNFGPPGRLAEPRGKGAAGAADLICDQISPEIILLKSVSISHEI